MDFCYTISKYDPTFYVNGIFVKDEWTDFSDIGKIFDNKELTREEYEKTENNYINFIVSILDFINVHKLKISDLEIYTSVQWKNVQTIPVSKLPELIRDCLRNNCWCKIHGSEICLCFGFDFYLHLNCNLNYDTVNKISRNNSLFLKHQTIQCRQSGDGCLR